MVEIQNKERKAAKTSIPKEILIPAFFLFLTLFYNPSLIFAPHHPYPLFFLTCGALSLAATGLILLDPENLAGTFLRMKKLPLTAFLIFLILAAGQCFFYPYSPENAGENLIWLTIPLLMCLYAENAEKLFRWYFSLLWFWNLVQLIAARFSYKHPYFWRGGIAANPNWNAALLAVTTPFIVLLVYDFMSCRKISAFRKYAVSGIFAAVGIGYFLYSRSAGCCLAVAAMTVFLFFCYLPAKWRKILFFAGLCCLIAGTLLFVRFGVDRLAGRMAYDERLTLWQGTVNMIMDHPVSGAGGQSFETRFVAYKPLELFLKKHVAPRTGHPHNHILYMLACFGFIGGLAWLFLQFWPLILTGWRLWNGKEDFAVVPCFFAYGVITLHAQLDVLLVNWPTNIIALLLMGFFWHRTLLKDTQVCLTPKTEFFRKCAVAAGCAVLLLAAWIVCRSAYSSIQVQRLMITRFSRAQSENIIRRVIRVCPDGYTQNYALLIYARMILRDPQLTLEVIDVMKRGNIPEYGNIHLFRGDAFAQMKKYEEAFKEYSLEAKNWPLAVIPVCKMMAICQIRNDSAGYSSLNQILNNIRRIKNINDRMLQYILKKPSFDLQPWLIPVEHGGPGGFGKVGEMRDER